MGSPITVDSQGGVATVRANRPPVNAMSPALIAALQRAVAEVGVDPDVRCVVFASAVPDYFMVGFDLGFIRDRLERGPTEDDLAELREIAAMVHDTMAAIEALPQPTIAAISGHAVGGGAELALCCDIRIMADDPRYRIGFPETQLGLVPAAGGTQRLPRTIGLSRALPMLLEGRRVGAAEAARIGLVHDAVPADDLEGVLAERVARLTRASALAQRVVKRCVRATARGEDGFALERDGFADCVASEDTQRRILAFLGK